MPQEHGRFSGGAGRRGAWRRSLLPLSTLAVAGTMLVAPGDLAPSGAGQDLATIEELPATERETLKEEALLARQSARRDALVEQLQTIEGGRSALASLINAWRRRQIRSELEELVAKLQDRQARLLKLRARRAVLAQRRAERDWASLESVVARAATAWNSDEREEASFTSEISEALDRAGAAGWPSTLARYRFLVERLASVNLTIQRLERSAARAAGTEAAPGGGRGYTGASPMPPVEQPGPTGLSHGAPRFLGVDERGAAFNPRDRYSLEAWTAVRAALAAEIEDLASRITQQARRSP
jgi:hypothetical protein